MSRREFSLHLLLLLSALAGACEGGQPPGDRRPEITLEKIREDINGKRVGVPADGGASEPSSWQFLSSEPKEVEILEKQLAGDQATFVIDRKLAASRLAASLRWSRLLYGCRIEQLLTVGFCSSANRMLRTEGLNVSSQHT